MLQRDYLMRMIALAIAAIARALGLKQSGESDQALAAIGEAYDAVLKFDRDMLTSLDSTTVISMLGDDQIVRLVARISKIEGDLRQERSEPARALACYRRALELYGAVGVGNDSADLDAAQDLGARFRDRDA